MFDIKTVEIDLGGKTLKLETGRVARQANGSVIATMGDFTGHLPENEAPVLGPIPPVGDPHARCPAPARSAELHGEAQVHGLHLSAARQRIYRKSDAILEVPLPDAAALVPLAAAIEVGDLAGWEMLPTIDLRATTRAAARCSRDIITRSRRAASHAR